MRSTPKLISSGYITGEVHVLSWLLNAIVQLFIFFYISLVVITHPQKSIPDKSNTQTTFKCL